MGSPIHPRLLSGKSRLPWAVVVAQLVERLLPILEVCGSNPVIGQNLYERNWVGGIVGGSVRFVRNAFFTLTNACKGGSPGLVVMGGD